MIRRILTPTVLLALLVAGCDPQKGELAPADNPDDFAADFRIYETFYNGHKVATDTVVRFAALMHFEQRLTQFKWQVGNNEYFTRDLFLRFNEEDMTGPIPVTLYAKRFFSVNGTSVIKADTVTRLLHLKTLDNSSVAPYVSPEDVVKIPYLGSFSGSFTDAPSHLFTIYIADHGPTYGSQSDGDWRGVRIYNLPEGCGTGTVQEPCGIFSESDLPKRYYAPEIDPGYLGFTAEGGANTPGSCCPEVNARGVITNDARDSIRIECRITYGGVSVQNRVFLGKRVK